MRENIKEIVIGYFSSLVMLIIISFILLYKQYYDGSISSIRIGFIEIAVMGSMMISFIYLILLLPAIIISYFIQHLKNSTIILHFCLSFLTIVILLIMNLRMDSDLLIYSIPIISHLLRGILIAFRST